jgi:subtilisin-like proprotein convertase family protein
VPYVSPLAASNLVTDTDYTANSVETTLVGEEALAAFIGEDPTGTWPLTIHDDGATLDSGSLDSWSLAVTALDAAPTNASPVSAANATPAVIEDDAPPNVVSSTVEITGADTFLCDVNLNVNITHTFTGDLDFTLMSPAGTIVTVSTDNGGGFDNAFAGTTFDDDADPNGQVPQFNNPGSVTDHPYVDLTVVASLTSEEALGAFIGEDPNGTWTLTISDDANLDGGMLNSWSIDVVTCACDEPPVCEGDTDDSGAVDVDDLVNVILAWGPCPNCPPDPCAADVFPFPAGDCNVNVDDLVSVVLNWGDCP